MKRSDLEFDLPQQLIAQTPADRRTDARLLHYRRDGHVIRHSIFAELPELLLPGDLLVFNDVRVTPARFALVKDTGGLVEGLFVEELGKGVWQALLKGLGTIDPQRSFTFEADPSVEVQVVDKLDDDGYELRVYSDLGAAELLERVGRMPLPPYIKRQKGHDDAFDAMDRERYQTVYASGGKAVAAPTAGLHFTPQLLDRLDDKGVDRCAVTLEVGLGTFKPVESDELDAHDMHAERYRISEASAEALNAAKRDGRRIVAVGTTCCRVLESQPGDEPFKAHEAESRLFKTPGHEWKHVGALVTNFHLPGSTLIALVASFVGLEAQREIYADAIQRRYRFFSYGDASLLE